MTLRLIAPSGDVVRDVLPPLAALVAVVSDRAMLVDVARVRAPAAHGRPSHELDADEHLQCLMNQANNASIVCDMDHIMP